MIFTTCLLANCVFICLSCSKDRHSKIVYNDSELMSQNITQINCDTIKSSYEFANPEQIFALDDSLLVIFEPDAENVCKIISNNGKLMGEFGKKGKSQEELISPVCMVVENNDIVGVYDYNTMKLQRYSVKKLLSGCNAFLSSLNFRDFLSKEEKSDTKINSIVGYGENRYILFGNNENRIMLADTRKITDTYTEYPPTDEDSECNWAIWAYSSRYGVSPNRQHIVTTTYVGTLFEVFDISSGEIKSSLIKGFVEPKYGIAKGANPKWITPDYEHPEGFYALYVDDEIIFATIGGKDCEHRNELYTFNYSGMVERKFSFSCDIKCMTKQSGYMYFLLESQDGEIIFCRKNVQTFN